MRADTRLPLEPGMLDRRVEIQQYVDGTDSSGFPMPTWSTLDTVWMGREAIRGMERVQAGFAQSSYDARWTMHYRSDMDPDAHDIPKERRLVWGGRVLEIVDAQHIGLKQAIQLTTRTTTQAPEVTSP